MRGSGRALRAAMMAGLLAGCAAHSAQRAATPQPAERETRQYATIVAIRPPSGEAAPVLAALGARTISGRAAASEFIVRDIAGRTVSVVQANSDGLRAGDQVVLVGTSHTRLIRPPSA